MKQIDDYSIDAFADWLLSKDLLHNVPELLRNSRIGRCLFIVFYSILMIFYNIQGEDDIPKIFYANKNHLRSTESQKAY